MEVRQIRWTDPARDDLGSIFDYISHDSPIKADRIIDHIVKQTDLLADFPFVGTSLVYKNVRLRQILARNFRLIYHVSGDTVTVVAVIHSSRDLQKFLKLRLPR